MAFPNPETTQQDSESWSTSRLEPFVSDTRVRDVIIGRFVTFNGRRPQWLRTEECVFRVTEYSRSGQGAR